MSSGTASVLLKGDSAIEPQYFLNRLYVAASRPRKRLFVIDSSEDIDSFWNQIFSKQDTFIVRSDHASEWEGMTGQILKGSLESWEGDKEDSLDIAEKLEREGILRKDRILLRQAAQSYEAARRTILAKKCRAEALELEKQHLEAARTWKEIGEHDRSVSSAWRCGNDGYAFILDLANEIPSLKNRIHFKCATFLISQGGINDGVALLKDLSQALDDSVMREDLLTAASWRDAIDGTLKKTLVSRDPESGLWKVAYANANLILESGVRLNRELVGELAFRGDLLKEAYRHWETIPAESRSKFERNFLRSKASTMEFPQNLDVYGELLTRYRDRSDAQEVMNIVQREGFERLKAPHREAVTLARFTLGEMDELYANLSDVGSQTFLLEILSQALKGDKANQIQAVLGRLTNLLAEKQRWSELVEMFKTMKIKGGPGEELKWWGSKFPFQFAKPFVETLAGDGDIEIARNDTKTGMAHLIRERFGSDFSWKHEVHPLLVGRVLERAGMFKETLPYYEAMESSSELSEGVKNIAAQRWAKTKGLQAVHERERTTATGRADKLYMEAMEKAEKCGFSSPEEISDELPTELPDSEPRISAKSAAQAPKNEEGFSDLDVEVKDAPPSFARSVSFSYLEITVNSEGTRINIAHAESLEHATILVTAKTISFEGTRVELSNQSKVRIERWNLSVDFTALPVGKVVLEMNGGLQMAIPVIKVA
jgi:hypothetical protein